MSEKQVKDYDKFVLRLADGMKEAIAKRAKENGRSMNSEIVQILYDALDMGANASEEEKLQREAELYRSRVTAQKVHGIDISEDFETLMEITKRLQEIMLKSNPRRLKPNIRLKKKQKDE